MSNIPKIYTYQKSITFKDYPAKLSRIEFEKFVLYKMLEHHYSKGHNAPITERTYLSDIINNITKHIDQEYDKYSNRNNDSSEIIKIYILDEEVDRIKKEIEESPGFVQWFNIPNRYVTEGRSF